MRDAAGMLIRVYVTPNAREARVVKVSDDYFEVRVDERAVGGRANKRLLEILAEHFRVQKSRISILEGTKNKKQARPSTCRTHSMTRHCNLNKFPIGAGLFLPLGKRYSGGRVSFGRQRTRCGLWSPFSSRPGE